MASKILEPWLKWENYWNGFAILGLAQFLYGVLHFLWYVVLRPLL